MNITLYRIAPERNMARFYSFDLQPNLFGGWSAVRAWGRIGQAGQIHTCPFATHAEALAAIAKQRQTKERRGYVPAPLQATRSP